MGLVSISGGQKPAVRIQANPDGACGLRSRVSKMCAPRIAQANVNQAKGNFDGPQQAYHDRRQRSACCRSDDYRSLIVAYRNGAPVQLSDVATVIDGAENVKQAAWMNDDAGGDRQHPAAAGREHHRRRRSHQDICCRNCKASLARRRCDVSILTDRTTTIRASVEDVQFELMLTVRWS